VQKTYVIATLHFVWRTLVNQDSSITCLNDVNVIHASPLENINGRQLAQRPCHFDLELSLCDGYRVSSQSPYCEENFDKASCEACGKLRAEKTGEETGGIWQRYFFNWTDGGPHDVLVKEQGMSNDEYIELFQEKLGPQAYCSQTTNALGSAIGGTDMNHERGLSDPSCGERGLSGFVIVTYMNCPSAIGAAGSALGWSSYGELAATLLFCVLLMPPGVLTNNQGGFMDVLRDQLDEHLFLGMEPKDKADESQAD
jgi:hypothetical protein